MGGKKSFELWMCTPAYVVAFFIATSIYAVTGIFIKWLRVNDFRIALQHYYPIINYWVDIALVILLWQAIFLFDCWWQDRKIRRMINK